MLKLLKDLYNKVEAIKGKKLAILLVSLFLIFIIVGLVIGYIANLTLTEPEMVENSSSVTVHKPQIKRESLSGKIEHVNEDNYDVSYVLVDENGKDVMLLDADDDKLSISEGLFVTVSGIVKPSKDETKPYVMFVEEVSISNATN